MCMVPNKYQEEKEIEEGKTTEKTEGVAIYDKRDFELNRIAFKGKFSEATFKGYLKEFDRSITF